MNTQPMTDVEYYQISLLFERKRLNEMQIKSLERWIDNYTTGTGGWASPTELIETLNRYQDR